MKKKWIGEPKRRSQPRFRRLGRRRRYEVPRELIEVAETGDIIATRKKLSKPRFLIPLTQGKFVRVSKADFAWASQFNWHCQNGYAARRNPETDKIEYMHRLILKTPAGMHTDHVNRNRLDNRRCNLRIVTPAQNARNKGLPRNVGHEPRWRRILKLRSELRALGGSL